MADLICAKEDLTSIANTIREKTGTTEQLVFPTGFNDAINNISTGTKPEQEKTVSVSENGTVTIVPDSGNVLSKATVTVNVQGSGGADIKCCEISYSLGSGFTTATLYYSCVENNSIVYTSITGGTGVVKAACGTIVNVDFIQSPTFSGKWETLGLNIELRAIPNEPVTGLSVSV